MMEAGKQTGPYPRFLLRGHLAARDMRLPKSEDFTGARRARSLGSQRRVAARKAWWWCFLSAGTTGVRTGGRCEEPGVPERTGFFFAVALS